MVSDWLESRYNPAYKPYAHNEFIGRPVSSAYNDSIVEPYTGYIPVKEFLSDIQAAQVHVASVYEAIHHADIASR